MFLLISFFLFFFQLNCAVGPDCVADPLATKDAYSLRQKTHEQLEQSLLAELTECEGFFKSLSEQYPTWDGVQLSTCRRATRQNSQMFSTVCDFSWESTWTAGRLLKQVQKMAEVLKANPDLEEESFSAFCDVAQLQQGAKEIQDISNDHVLKVVLEDASQNDKARHFLGSFRIFCRLSLMASMLELEHYRLRIDHSLSDLLFSIDKKEAWHLVQSIRGSSLIGLASIIVSKKRVLPKFILDWEAAIKGDNDYWSSNIYKSKAAASKPSDIQKPESAAPQAPQKHRWSMKKCLGFGVVALGVGYSIYDRFFRASEPETGQPIGYNNTTAPMEDLARAVIPVASEHAHRVYQELGFSPDTIAQYLLGNCSHLLAALLFSPRSDGCSVAARSAVQALQQFVGPLSWDEGYTCAFSFDGETGKFEGSCDSMEGEGECAPADHTVCNVAAEQVPVGSVKVSLSKGCQRIVHNPFPATVTHQETISQKPHPFDRSTSRSPVDGSRSFTYTHVDSASYTTAPTASLPMLRTASGTGVFSQTLSDSPFRSGSHTGSLWRSKTVSNISSRSGSYSKSSSLLWSTTSSNSLLDSDTDSGSATHTDFATASRTGSWHWDLISANGAPGLPAQRYAHATGLVGGDLLVAFGANTVGTAMYAGSTFNFATSTWRNLNNSAPAVSEVNFCTNGSSTWVFGGWGNTNNALLNFSQSGYTTLPTTGAIPVGIGGAAMAVMGDVFYMFGGYPAVNTLWSCDISQTPVTWRDITPSYSPSARWDASMVAIKNKLYLYGGLTAGNFGINDFWCYDPNTTKWAQVPLTGAQPRGRGAYAMGVLGEDIFIFGGTYVNGGLLNDLLRLDTKGIITELIPNGQDTSPTARDVSGSLVWVNSNFYLFGGWNGAARNDFWRLSYGN